MVPYITLWLTLFLVYWVIGGAFFALFAFMRQAKYRRAQFGCLYTIISAGCAVAATYSTALFESENVNACLTESSDVFDKLAALFGCGVMGLTLMTLLWLIVLAALSGVVMYFSRAQNQSWMDEDHVDEYELEVSFDSV